jgi:hypothetical protein
MIRNEAFDRHHASISPSDVALVKRDAGPLGPTERHFEPRHMALLAILAPHTGEIIRCRCGATLVPFSASDPYNAAAGRRAAQGSDRYSPSREASRCPELNSGASVERRTH